MNKFRERLLQVDKETRDFINKSDEIAQLIVNAMKHKGWSKSYLAEKLGKNNSIITRYISGQHNFTLKSLVELETVLECNICSVGKNNLVSMVISVQIETEKMDFNNPFNFSKSFPVTNARKSSIKLSNTQC